MKIKSTLIAFTFLTIAFLFMNNAGGPADVQGIDRTGSPLSPGACGASGCHDAGAFDPTVSVTVINSSNMPVSVYEPGESYRLRVTINAGSGTAAEYGFQAIPLDTDNNYAGVWGSIPNGGQQLVSFVNGLEYMEHSEPSTSNTFTTTSWDAPAAGGGDVTFYVGALATNDNGNPGGDGGVTGSVTLAEASGVSTDEIGAFSDFSVYPNPTQNLININVNSRTAGTAQLKVLDTTGKLVYSETVAINEGAYTKQINVRDLNTGLYMLQLVHDTEVLTKTIVKM